MEGMKMKKLKPVVKERITYEERLIGGPYENNEERQYREKAVTWYDIYFGDKIVAKDFRSHREAELQLEFYWTEKGAK